MICYFRTIWYNVKYFNIFLLNGLIADGHNLYYTGLVHNDHWEMKCSDCDKVLASEIGPDTEPTELI